MHGEAYAQFIARAHQALMPVVLDWEQRNQLVWQAWESANGSPLHERAEQYFAQKCPRHVENVCYFMEHETRGRDGTPLRYGFQELADIVDEHNHRASLHNYPAIADRHTSDHPVPTAMEPKILGFAGPARLGMAGDKFAVFFDEYHRADGMATLDEKPRRSVEVNRYRDGRRSYFDPIAALGADSPRLPLPVPRYSSDAEVERYQMIAPAMVSGGNTFIPGTDDENKPQRYAEEQPAVQDNDQMVQQIVAGIQSTPEMQWVRSQMQAQQGSAPAAGAQGQAPKPQQPSATTPAGPGGAGDDQYMSHNQYGAPKADMPMMGQPQQPPMMGQPAMPQPQQYQRYSNDNDTDFVSVEKYSELEATVEKYQQTNRDLLEQVLRLETATAQLEAARVDADRELAIRELYQAFPHFIDVDREIDKCLYSRGSEMSNEQFLSHLDDLKTYASKSPVATAMIPGGAMPVEKYAAKEALDERIRERYAALEANGEWKSYDAIKAEVIAEMQGK